MNHDFHRWLAASNPEPNQAENEWQDHGLALLRLGRFEVVRIPDAIVHAAMGSAEDAVVDFALTWAVEGAVIHDSRGRNHYALVAPGTKDRWRIRAGVECLGPGTHLGVPGPSLVRATPHRPIYWAALPASGSYFCRTAVVQLLVRVGAARLAEAAEVPPPAPAKEAASHG
ncbi:hypothetical protein J7E97_11615 [Streptomyces sp. ISL-66]|uniref:hypothetical protein n=1 Tax=Streptomyces sp. ISL-66 TaxID=2819186 RepID=UPI001BE6792F|nr:hypothetical protein [Streptomyces sp. ISL-66]MBT2468508.1 hypothetical protein [Streptomyces sp. ISL-66]